MERVVVCSWRNVTLNDKVFLLTANQSTFIPRGEVYRMENPTAELLKIIEV